ncbi:MAG TPA: amidohydrolase family protein [Rhodopila sp.]|uniref:amidohydrolase family protein n=1 Tax=Rhodopila sp. TaxID=2480087 RepID=UPI002B607678|nr:amidohydrolase family protein [Rhodopila sp.]HVY16676.1 amidohydrolase family protein [Rhodopila sp.]
MIDLIIRGDTVVTPGGVGAYDILISGERIAAMAAPGTITPPPGARVIDAGGKIVMPGGIDPHVHCKWHMPAPAGEPATLTAGPEVVGKAAVHGGTTTVIDFTRAQDQATVQKSIETREQDWKGNCACDYATHLMVEGALPVDLPPQVAEAIQAGFPTVKIFTTDITPNRKGRMVDFGDIWEIFQVLAANKGLGVIHSEDNDIVMHMYGKLIREGRTGFENMAEVHNTLSEDVSFRRVIRLAEKVPGTALYMMHTSAATGVSAIREARSRGTPIYGESLHQYMLYTYEDYKKPNGQIYHTYPSLKGAEDHAALWQGTLEGAINCVATDEICCTLKQKIQGVRIDDTTGGNAGVQPRVPLMYTEMVGKRGYTLNRFVDLVSSNAAKIMGLYPRKGALAAGSDADICVLDPADKRVVKASEMHEADYSPWEGRKMEAWPCLTVLRGKVVVENGVYKGGLADGKWQHRKIADEMLTAPRL